MWVKRVYHAPGFSDAQKKLKDIHVNVEILWMPLFGVQAILCYNGEHLVSSGRQHNVCRTPQEAIHRVLHRAQAHPKIIKLCAMANKTGITK